MKHLDIKIYGQVQGVSFRYYAKEQAMNLDLVGFVRNEEDGCLHIEVEGEQDALEKFINWCHKGPALARVEKVEIAESDIKGYKDFRVLPACQQAGVVRF